MLKVLLLVYVLQADCCSDCNSKSQHMGVSQNWGYLFGVPYNKDYSTLESRLGFPNFGEVPHFSFQDNFCVYLKKYGVAEPKNS